MLGLAGALPATYKSVFVSFAERGLCRPFLYSAQQHGFATLVLKENAPRYLAAIREIVAVLRCFRADILLCHGYKSDLLGLIAAVRLGIPVVSVSHGWTAVTVKVRANEALDRVSLHFMDAIVCVSEAQAAKVRRLGIAADRVAVIRNAIDPDRFAEPDLSHRDRLQRMFAEPRRIRIIGAAGRLSPEKGFADLVVAARKVIDEDPMAGFVIFGEGPLRADLTRRIAEWGLAGKVVLPGFREDLDHYIAAFDLLVLPSYTEGMPSIVLESLAAGVPVVATAVGGTPEVIQDGVTGYLLPSGDPVALAERILRVLRSEDRGRSVATQGRKYAHAHLTFKAQAAQYELLLSALAAKRSRVQVRPSR